MKKILSLAIALTFVLSAMTANAYVAEDFTLTYNGVTYTADMMTVAGSSTVTQYLDLSDGELLNDGDAFTESGYLGIVSIKNDATTTYNVNFNGYLMYFYAENLTGTIRNVNLGTGADPEEIFANSAFDYVFDTGTTFTLFATTNTSLSLDTAGSASDIALVYFTVTSASGGPTDQNYETGTLLSGFTDVVIEFTDDFYEVFGLDSGASVDELLDTLQAYLTFDLANNLVGDVTALFDDDNNLTGLQAVVETQGTVRLIITPEPSTFAFLGLGLGLLGLVAYRRKVKTNI